MITVLQNVYVMLLLGIPTVLGILFLGMWIMEKVFAYWNRKSD
jgi:hypothetical protein